MIKPCNLHGPHAVKLFLSTDLKTRIAAMADALDRPIADVCRQLLWMSLPIVEGMQAAHLRGSRWWLAVTGFQPDESDETLEETV